MNKRGQALIEFVLILPVLLLIIFAFIDFGRIIICKTHLEGVMSEVVSLYNTNEKEKIDEYLKKDDYFIKYQVEDKEFRKFTLKTKIDLITPGLRNILHNPYEVMVERSIVYE